MTTSFVKIRKHISTFAILLVLILTQSCSTAHPEILFNGFWEGPHPEDVNKKFYVQIIQEQDSAKAAGFWTDHSFYDSKFEIDSISLDADSIGFRIPAWDCFYSGRICGDKLIRGGFSCTGEPFDTVSLNKNNEISRYLTEAKPGCLQGDYSYQYREPDFLEECIPVSHPRSPGDSLFINSIIPEIIEGQYGRINSFLVLKEGGLICEEYFYGYTRHDLHQIESATKSITSLLIGIAKDRGMISSLSEALYEIFPEYDHLRKGDYSQITLENILTMTSCFSDEYEPYREYDRIEYSLKRKIIAPVGSQFVYDGGNTEILGAVIKRKSGIYADIFAEKYLFEPLGISRFDWGIFKQDGYPCMGGSLQMLPADMAKIGQMVLDEGRFKGEQIISAHWIRESTSAKTETHIEGDEYGYQWWRINLESGNKNYETTWANGWGSQFIYIVPELEVVIVTTGNNYEYDSWSITGGIAKYLYLLEN